MEYTLNHQKGSELGVRMPQPEVNCLSNLVDGALKGGLLGITWMNVLLSRLRLYVFPYLRLFRVPLVWLCHHWQRASGEKCFPRYVYEY